MKQGAMSVVLTNYGGGIFVNAILHPRDTVRGLKEQGPSVSRTLLIVSVYAPVMFASSFWQAVVMQEPTSKNDYALFGNFPADSLFAMGTAALLYPISVFVWSFLFRFRDDRAGVRAAVDTSFACQAAFALLGTVLTVSVWRLGAGWQLVDYLWFAELGLSLIFGMVYFSEALNITQMISFLLNVSAFVISMGIVLVPLFCVLALTGQFTS